MLVESGCIERKNGHRVDPSLLRLEEGVSCACGCVIYHIVSSVESSQ